MWTVKVRQFYETEDAPHEFVDELELDLTSAELALLEGASGTPIYLETYNGLFVLVQDD
jgi:hypothetical protein